MRREGEGERESRGERKRNRDRHIHRDTEKGRERQRERDPHRDRQRQRERRKRERASTVAAERRDTTNKCKSEDPFLGIHYLLPHCFWGGVSLVISEITYERTSSWFFYLHLLSPYAGVTDGIPCIPFMWVLGSYLRSTDLPGKCFCLLNHLYGSVMVILSLGHLRL